MVTGLADPAGHRYLQPQPGQATATAAGGGLPGLDRGLRRRLRPARDLHPLPEPLGRGGPVAAARPAATCRTSASTVDFGELESGRSDNYAPAPGHFYNRIFRSNQDYGEGISLKNDPSAPGGSPDPQFLSPYQPYGLYIPAGYAPGRTRLRC